MNLKEKLAKEYNASRLEHFVSVKSNEEAFIAGFETARDMAVDLQEKRETFYLMGEQWVMEDEQTPMLEIIEIDKENRTITFGAVEEVE